MPRQEWTKKEERQYEHIKDSARESGASTKRAKEIAARTVQKQRQQEGKTERKTPGGTGNPNLSLEDRTLQEIRNRAKDLDIEGRSQMNKQELIRAIRRRQ